MCTSTIRDNSYEIVIIVTDTKQELHHDTKVTCLLLTMVMVNLIYCL